MICDGSSSGSLWLPVAHAGQGIAIKWCKKGEYLVSLGIPHGWDFSEEEFFMSKYTQCKSMMAKWHDVERMSIHGSARVANAMVYSRFRYYAQCMVMPKRVSAALDLDVQQLIWGRDVDLDPEELGSSAPRR